MLESVQNSIVILLRVTRYILMLHVTLNMNQTVSTMLEQIDRRPSNEPLKLLTSLRAKDVIFSDKDNFVQFSVSGDKGVNKVKVTYDTSDDFYNVEFLNINLNRKEIVKTVDSINGVYNEELTDTIWRGCVIV